MAELNTSMSGRLTAEAILVGSCSQCGMCCERILLVEPDPETGEERDASNSDNPDIVEIRRHLVVGYHRPDGVPVWRCKNLKWYAGKGSCTIYGDRPKICRDFPLNNIGDLPPKCSYKFVRRENIIAELREVSSPVSK